MGSLKGSQETLLQRAGNAHDLASLLIALLHEAGIEARYARGTIRLPISLALEWLGVDSARAVEEILHAAEKTPGVGGFQARLEPPGPGATTLQMPHIWVEARLPGAPQEWTPLDPSFKPHVVVPGRNVATEAGLSGRNLMQILLGPALPGTLPPSLILPGFDSMRHLLLSRQKIVLEYLQSRHPLLTLREIVGNRSVAPERISAWPERLPFEVVGPVVRFDEIPPTERHYIRIFFQGINVELPMPEIASRRLTLGFAGAAASDDAKLAANGGVLGLRSTEVRLKPQLLVDGAVRAEGFGMAAGASLSNFLQITFRRGPFVQQTVSHSNLSNGGAYAIVLDTQIVSTEKIRRTTERLRAAATEAGAARAVEQDAIAGELLNLVGMAFFAYQDRFAEYGAGTQNVVAFQSVNEALIGLDLSAGADGTLSLGRIRIDNQRNDFTFVARDGNPSFDPSPLRFMVLAASSGLEDSVFRYVAGVPAVSTTKVFAAAALDQTELVAVTPANRDSALADLEVPALVRGAITTAVAQGRTVIVPRHSVAIADWTGTGWVEHPLHARSGGFLLSGNIAGGQVVVKVFTGTPQEQRLALQQMAEFGYAFGDGFVRGDLSGDYNTPAGAYGQATGNIVSSLFIYGDLRDSAYAIGEVVGSGGQQGWQELGFAGLGFLAVGDVLKLGRQLERIQEVNKRFKPVAEAAAIARTSPLDAADAQHIATNHLAGTPGKKSKFSSGIGLGEVKGLIDEALSPENLRSGKSLVTTNSSADNEFFRIYHQFDTPIGEAALSPGSKQTAPTCWMRVVVEAQTGKVVTAFPDYVDPQLVREFIPPAVDLLPRL